jgi:hypothetical protein
MITKDQIVNILTYSFPTFVLDEENRELPYVILGDFTRFLLEAFQRKDESLLKDAAALIERLHIEGDGYVKEAATIGLLEGIQNTWPDSGVDSETIASYLLPESRRWWNSLNRFWNKEIPYVGADVK